MTTVEIGILSAGTVLLCKVPEAILLFGSEGIGEVGLVLCFVDAIEL